MLSLCENIRSKDKKPCDNTLDYRGEIMVSLHNHSTVDQTIEPNERIAQLVVTPFIKCEYLEVTELDETSRGVGGFGSTGEV